MVERPHQPVDIPEQTFLVEPDQLTVRLVVAILSSFDQLSLGRLVTR
ncbi:MAG: hypothetical protein AB1644_07300 [Candidatus Zixiibacteriota bacterium]